ncbi:MATE family efflux transporter [Marimonas arenosa]|uniref:MATE family efflux transporter n=2 Tax=Pseudomonadati TaxID=3379134 RepID=A0AAE3WF41_9RHOB|nr:MATE family efflux transporter [Marimonas arenosa]MDQ2091539.1 MATE family efflux transporter [Marimonas arenosa]
MVNEKAKFLEGSLMRHIAVMALTSSVGLMAVFLVDLVDMVFISWLGRDELAAAVGYSGAILFFTTSFGIGMAIAAGARVARAVGEGDIALARQRAATSLIYAFGLGAVFAAVVWWQIPALVALLGASGTTLALAQGYLSIIVPSLPFLMLGMVGGAILRAYGDARRSMMATLYGGVVNAVLDPILIFGLALDLKGAALATVAARLTIAATALIPVFRHHGGLERPTARAFTVDFGGLAAIAGPAVLTQLATPMGQAYVTRAMAAFGEDAVAGLAIISRLLPVAFAVIFALSGAIGPIIGQNYGARKMGRVRRAFRDGVLFAGAVVLAVAALLFLLRAPIADLFGAEGEARRLVYLFCGPIALLYFFNGVIFVANAAFNNLGRPFLSTWVNWGRHTLGTVPFVMAGAALVGAPGVLIGQAVGGIVFGALAWLLARRIMARERGRAAPGDDYARQGRLLALFSFKR